METLPPLDPVTRLSRRVIRIMGDNPGKFTLQGSNTYLIGTGARRILLDTGDGRAAWRERLQATLAQEAATLEAVLLTHWHGDHVGGVADARALVPDAKFYKHRPDAGQLEIHDGQVFRTQGAELRAVFCPGHTNDHMAFVLSATDGKKADGDRDDDDDDDGAMFTGDNVLGHGTAVFEDLAAYMQSLERMRREYGEDESRRLKAYPGHGAVLQDGKAKISEYITHRRQREIEILDVLRSDAPEARKGWTSMEIVKVVYKDYPENLHVPAEGGVKLVLAKLETDGRLIRDGERWDLTEKARSSL